MPSELAAQRGEPSYVWRSGQERRLTMMREQSKVENACILIAGCGVGMYSGQIIERFSSDVEAFDIELPRVEEARATTPRALVAAAEMLPYTSNQFDTILSNEVLEHVQDDLLAAQEMVRVTKTGGRIVIFCPNRWYPFETHGHYWRGKYHFGNTPMINYLPDAWRSRLAPHVRAYTQRGLLRLFHSLPVKVAHYERIYGGYDNLAVKLGAPGKLLRRTLHSFEGTALDTWGLSHFLVMEKVAR
jgi:SAM-dependent methyltransferase